MTRVSTMVNAISLLWLQGWHAPAGRRTCETPASSQARQIRPAVPVGAMKPGPGRQIVSQDSPSGSSRFGGQAGTQAPDPNAPSSQSQGGRAGSITYILPAESGVCIRRVVVVDNDAQNDQSVQMALVAAAHDRHGHASCMATLAVCWSLLAYPHRDIQPAATQPPAPRGPEVPVGPFS